MKRFILRTLLACLLLLGFQTTKAQTLNRSSLMSELNNTGKVKLNDVQKSKFDESNQRLADDLFELDKNAKTKEEREKGIDELFDRHDREIDDIFGSDDIFKDTKKELKKNTKGMRRKVKVAKLVI